MIDGIFYSMHAKRTYTQNELIFILWYTSGSRSLRASRV